MAAPMQNTHVPRICPEYVWSLTGADGRHRLARKGEQQGGSGEVNRLREFRERCGWTQEEVVAEIYRRAIERGDPVSPGLDQPAVSRHENGKKRPGPRIRALYCELYGVDAADLGFRVAFPGENGDPEDVDRREFLTGAAGFVASASLAPVVPTRRLGPPDLVRLRQAVVRLYELDEQHGGAGGVYPLTMRTFHRLRGLIERASYDEVTGRALRQLAGEAAGRIGWLEFDAGRQDDARSWGLEALHWARLADADSVSVGAMAAMARQAADQGRPREAIDLATAAQRTAKRATPRLTSVLLAREALGHAGAGDARSARAALCRARGFADRTRREDDPRWLDFYGMADFACYEYRVALMLGDSSAAEDAARTSLALGDPVGYPRNHALDLVNLANVLAQRRKIDESVAVVCQAATAAADVDSGRVVRGLRGVAQRLAPFKDDPSVAPRLDAVHAALPS
jgi:transcriptional regulator with XRE-family HTH domain